MSEPTASHAFGAARAGPACSARSLVAAGASAPSCEKKKQLLWAEWLQKEVLEPVPHRHVVLTMPRLLRGIFRKRESFCSTSRNAVLRPSPST
jgi:hypothetical protein